MLQKIDVSQARGKLSDLMNRVYFDGEKYLLLRRGIPMALIARVDEKNFNQSTKPHKLSTNSLFGIWKSRKESTVKISKILRKQAWETKIHAG